MRTWRAVYRIDQQTAGDLVGVSARTWRRWEAEDSSPNEDNYNTINYVISFPPPWWQTSSAGELADRPAGAK
jgi:hypothetical protein